MTNVNTLITDHLDIWTTATEAKPSSGRGNSKKTGLYGIQKLRSLILELAVRGKLVPQYQNEGDGSGAVAKLARKREELVKQKLAKTAKKLDELHEGDFPFPIPHGWSWARLQDVSEYIQRGKGPKYADSGAVRVISQKCVQWNGFDLDKARFIREDSIEGYGQERFLRDGDVLWNSTGTGTVGRVVTLPLETDDRLVADSHVTVIRMLSDCPRFLEIYLSSSGIQNRIEPTHEDALVSGTTKQVELNVSTVLALPVPFPPMAEQHRIVAKVEELMTLCDALEAQTEDSLKAHQTLVETCLATLTNSQSPEELTENWNRIETNFDTLFTTEESVECLRDAVLSLAIRGLLTKRYSPDEPASVLLEQLFQSNMQTANSRHRTIMSKIREVEPPFPIPPSWAWSNLGSLSFDLRYGTSKKCGRDDSQTPVLRIPNVSGGQVTLEDMKFGPLEEKELSDLALRQNDLLIIRSNGSLEIVGRFAWVPELDREYAFAGYLVRVRIDPAFVDPRYIWYVSQSRFVRDQIELPIRHGVGLKNVNSTELASIAFPIPPREEQKEVIYQIDSLFEYCDKLLKKIVDKNESIATLADTLTGKVH
ncbi:restriction endonuclease subunit S [Thalassococcus lentus]|uniref:Restriction endonuclease subunit S n=1 Tax=Thalassococcus lentus TaxID=1210524 RepID=A0ABT4XUD9_9RHOB|nr:restriction endonuclease subunit S [Thalassococcus lentus]MDA7425428.1 restriction endonuclease subunit S [Thalassococcus lentus]